MSSNAPAEPLVLRWLKAFGAFWWDFFVGDTPEIFLGTVALLVVVTLASVVGHLHQLGAALLCIGVLGVLALSVAKAARATKG